MASTSIKELNSICCVIQQHAQQTLFLGFYLDLRNGQTLRGVFHPPIDDAACDIRAINERSFVDLCSILTSGGNDDGRDDDLHQRRRTTIALAVTSSVNWLRNTEWLRESWDNEDIVFPCD